MIYLSYIKQNRIIIQFNFLWRCFKMFYNTGVPDMVILIVLGSKGFHYYCIWLATGALGTHVRDC